MRIASREFLGVGKVTHPEPLPYLSGIPCGMSISHNAHGAYYSRMLVRNQGYYARWTLCIIQPWAGECKKWPCAMYADTSGFHLSSTLSSAPLRSAGARCGIRTGSMDARIRRRVRRGAAIGFRSNSSHPMHTTHRRALLYDKMIRREKSRI